MRITKNEREDGKIEEELEYCLRVLFEDLNPVEVDISFTFVYRRPIDNLKRVLKLKHQKDHEGDN